MSEPQLYLEYNKEQRQFHADDIAPSKPYYGWKLIAKDAEPRVLRFLQDKQCERVFQMNQREAIGFYLEWQAWFQRQLGPDHYSNWNRSNKGKQTWVYLMKDLRSGYIKIGESTKPKYRETTLQAEQPLIELIDAWEGTTQDEKFFHEKFAAKRLRGEWFDLSDGDVELIADMLYARPRLSVGKSQEQIDTEDAARAFRERAELDHKPTTELIEKHAYNAAAVDFTTEGFGSEF